jgi:hypothetical protein
MPDYRAGRKPERDIVRNFRIYKPAAAFFVYFCLNIVCGSCSIKVEGFSFYDAEGKETPLFLSSGEGWKEPGDLRLAPGQEIVFRFEKALSVGEGRALFLRFRDSNPQLFVAALGAEESGSRTAAARASLHRAADGGFALKLPPGTYSGFAIQKPAEPGRPKTGTAPGETPPDLRILRAELRPYKPLLKVGSSGVEAASDIFPAGALSSGGGIVRISPVPEDTEASLCLTITAPENPPGERPRITLRRKDKNFSAELQPRPLEEKIFFHSRFLGFFPEEFEISPLPGGTAWELELIPRPGWARDSPDFSPVPLDIGMILDSPAAWRHPDFEVFRWSLFPDVLIVDSRDYAVQKRLFHRLAFFIEKPGFRGKLHPDNDIWDKHGWNGHNYNAAGLAAFFETARKTAFPLGAEERWLESYLLSQGILRKDGDKIIPGGGGILGISRESYPAHRMTLLTHEAFHGVYYGLPGFRKLVEDTWKALPQDQKDFWNFFFTWMGYDIADPYLVLNEFQAYLLQQSLFRADAYYKGTITGRLSERYPERRTWLMALFSKYPGMFTRPARLFSDYLEKAAGIRAGDVLSVKK